MEKLKAPLPYIKDRAEKTASILLQIAPDWTAPNFPSPNNFADAVEELVGRIVDLVDKEAATAAAAGAWDGVLAQWHEASVLVAKVARGAFKGTDKAPVWQSVRAGGKGREAITDEGVAVAMAWKASGAAWVPRAGLTFAAFSAWQTGAAAKAGLYADAQNLEAITRGLVNVTANSIYDQCVRWYEMATGVFGEDTPQGSLIRTIPTNYNPEAAPGRLHFPEHYSPAPNQVRLVYSAPRGEKFNVYAKPPGAAGFTKILDGVTFTSWMGEGLAAGEWKFQGEAGNAEGLGEMSAEITVPVLAMMVA